MKFTPQNYSITDEAQKPFIDDKEIEGFLTIEPTVAQVREVIAKSLSKHRLSMEETAILINANSPESVKEIMDGARRLKQEIYGNRIVLFAPLYVGNYCKNNCSYCGFRSTNTDAIRHTLNRAELKKSVEALEDEGQKRLILVFGEHDAYSPEYIADTVRTVYAVKRRNGEIRRVNINAAPMEIEGYKVVKESGIGTYQIFQETYHKQTYAKYHLGGTKADYENRLISLDKAQIAGIDDVGIGVLFGLYDWKFELMALLRHVNHLEACFNVGPHTISFPRIQEASASTAGTDHRVNDEDFLKIIAILRLAVPYTGLILTAREPEHIRKQVLEFGVSQIDAGTKLEIGAYAENKGKRQNLKKEQFKVNDERSLSEVMDELITNGYLPSFCTSCYRQGRTGEHFMEFSVPGFIKRFCTPNAMLTLAEYLQDYATQEIKEKGWKLIRDHYGKVDLALQGEVLNRLERIKNGERDLYL
ncbi:MAG: [FeFe] hydrogenase H-cluster radical SAM maturase HydG [Bacteroidota bacterium]